MKCPKCGSERITKERYHTWDELLLEHKYLCIVKCERCGYRAEHKSYSDGEAMTVAKEKFKAAEGVR